MDQKPATSPETPATQPQPVSYQGSPESSAPPANTSPDSFIFTTPDSETPKPTTQRSFPLKIVLAIIIAIVLLAGASTVMYAYGVIPGNAKLQSQIADVLMTLPLFPKSPQYVLKSSALAQQKVSKATIDLSLAVSNMNAPSLGMNSLDVDVNGPIDYSDTDNPAYAFTVKLSKDFSMDLRMKNHIVYFNLDKFPTFLSGMLISFGITDETQKEFLKKWFYIDTTPLNTEARQALKKQDNKAEIAKLYDKVFTALNSPNVKKSLSMTSETLDGKSVYHLSFKPDDSTLDTFWDEYTKDDQKSPYATKTKLSDSIKNLTIDSWIDRGSYLSYKSVITFSYKSVSAYPSAYTSLTPLSTLGSSGEVPVSIAVKMSDFGKDVVIETPKNAVKFDDFFKEFAMKSATRSSSLSAFGNPSVQYAQANNTKRRSDVLQILNAIGQYAAENRGQLPPDVRFLRAGVPTTFNSKNFPTICSSLITGSLSYIPSFPTDPSLSSNDVDAKTCKTPWNTGYQISVSTDKRVTVSAPLAEMGVAISVTR